MSTIKSLPSDNTFNSVMEAKSSSLGFNHQKYNQQKPGFQKQGSQQHSVKKAAQDIVQKKLTQVTDNNKKPKKPVEELAVPVLLNLPTQIQHMHSGGKMAFLSAGYGSDKNNSEANHSLSTQPNDLLGQTVSEDDAPQITFNANVAAVSIGQLADTKIVKTKTMEQKAARFLSDNPTSVKQTQWMSIPLAQQTEVVDIAVLKSPLRDGQSNLVSEAQASFEPGMQIQHEVKEPNASASHEGRPVPNERPAPQHFPDMKSFNIEKSEVIQPDEIDITKNILTQVRAEMGDKPLAVTPQISTFQTSASQTSTHTQQASSMVSKVAELIAASEVESFKTVPSRTLSYTFSQWQNAPTVSFALASTNKDQVVASTQSDEVQQALQDNQHLWTGEQKMVIRREEQEGQQRQRQQQHQQDEES
ncbi:type III secretion protein [Providencia sp. JGM181]|uniref:SpaN/EivJ family type III secretion system needle length determinant n=1 Tax=unclassified Providencia TaxID=2633465 RepID=UPI001BAD4B2F|nr:MULTISPECIES: type III secretion protein [unclassified Providencia]MBS0923333.1 type III secretion protein [Providencia sp. JGM181]MBS0934071.1 type III secretion protein [Providencia sp. JGM172]MBS0998246.1 type III secretion protein [Providencia sp. JGM178]